MKTKALRLEKQLEKVERVHSFHNRGEQTSQAQVFLEIAGEGFPPDQMEIHYQPWLN